MNKDVKKLFAVLFFYALSNGIFYNFQEIWLLENNLSSKTISLVFSLCALLTVSTVFLCSNIVNQKIIKKFSCTLLLLKTIILFLLFLLNNTGLNIIIKFLIMIDYIVDVEIYACIYPMITFITKNDKIYAKRGLIYSGTYYIGILLTSFLLGKTISIIKIDYNIFCLIGSLLMLISYIILLFININKYNVNEDKTNKNIFNNVLKKAKQDKITRNYLGFTLFGNASYNSINGLFILLLTTNLGFTAPEASTFRLILGISSVIIGIIILEKLTFKNNYINISIKFGGRIVLFILAFLSNSKIFFLLAIIFMRLLTESYAHVTDAPYINRFLAEEQFAFCNLKEMISYFSKAIGNLMCGIALSIGTKYHFLFALIFIIFQIIFAFRALKFLNKEKKEEISYDR